MSRDSGCLFLSDEEVEEHNKKIRESWSTGSSDAGGCLIALLGIFFLSFGSLMIASAIFGNL
jgi:hypothetical protein